MSVVLQMKKPGTCRECFDTHRCFGTGKWYADGTIWCGLAKGYIGDERTKCPVIKLPEGHGRLGDLDILANMVNGARIEAMQKGFDTNPYWLLGDIVAQAKTIVQAEKGESKDGNE